MKAALLALWLLLKSPFTRLLSSMKFWTVVIGTVATWFSAWLARHGFDMTDAHVEQVAKYVAYGFGILLAGQGLADHGKEAAKLKGPTVEGVAGDVNVTTNQVTP